MAALTEGKVAPNATLRATDGSEHALRPARADGLLVLAFSKRSCPVCQLALPFIEALHRTYAGADIVGVSQDDRGATLAFMKEFGLTLPYLLDNDPYPVSTAFGLTNVPTLFLIDGAGKVLISSVGFSQTDIIEISQRLARNGRVPFGDPFADHHGVPQFRPG